MLDGFGFFTGVDCVSIKESKNKLNFTIGITTLVCPSIWSTGNCSSGTIRLALDCYKLMHYIEGGSNAEITGLLRLAEPNTSESALTLRSQGTPDDASGCPDQHEMSADTPGY